MNTRYDTDVIAWATEQAALLRSGRLAEIAINDTGLDLFPDHCPSTIDQVLNAAFYPNCRAARASAGAKHRIGAHGLDQDGVISNTEGLL
jgi:hypothetical protein